jgi:hypothetical protein
MPQIYYRVVVVVRVLAARVILFRELFFSFTSKFSNRCVLPRLVVFQISWLLTIFGQTSGQYNSTNTIETYHKKYLGVSWSRHSYGGPGEARHDNRGSPEQNRAFREIP